MENSSSEPLTINSDHRSLPQPPIPHAPSFALPEAPKDDWNPKQFLAMVRRRSLVIAGVAVTVMTAMSASTLTEQPIYEGRFQMLVEPVNSSDRSASELASGSSSRSGQAELDYATQIQVLQSPELLSDIAEGLRETYADPSYSSIPGQLSITRLGNTKILEVQYQDTDPARVQAVLKQAAEEYLEYSSKERQTNLRQGIQFVENQLPSSQERVDQLQQDLQAFRQEYNFVDPSSYAGQITSQTEILAQQRQAVEQALTQANFRLNNLRDEAGATAALNNSPAYQQLVSQLKQIDAEIAVELTRFQEQNLAIQVMREKQQNLLPLLRQEAERIVGTELAAVTTEIRALEAQRQAVDQAQQKLNQQLQQLPVIERRYNDLQRELQVTTESLNRFLAARENLQIEAAQKEIPWQIVREPVQPQAPISPDVKRGLMMGVFAGLAAGLGAALLLEKLDDVYRTAEELQQQTKLPVLGVIPWHPYLESIQNQLLLDLDKISLEEGSSSSEDVFHKPSLLQTLLPGNHLDNSSTFIDALRLLYTNIQLLNTGRPIQSLVVSSALSGDGKSTVALNLARTAAEMGKRVLLVDADLRHSQLHTQLNLINPKGLSNLLTGESSLNEVIHKPVMSTDLYILPAGQVQPDSTKLLSSYVMHYLMDEVIQSFDLVIYDTPSLTGLADANLLATRTDGILLVVRIGRTDRPAVKQTLDNLKLPNVPVLGIIANGME